MARKPKTAQGEANGTLPENTGANDPGQTNPPVAPIAPENDETMAAVEAAVSNVSTFGWAMDLAAQGIKVKRASWVGNKTISSADPGGQAVISTEDMTARDWVLADA